MSRDPFYQMPWTPDIRQGCVRLEWRALETGTPRTIQEVLRHEFGCSGTTIRRMRQPGLLMVDGQPARVRDVIRPGQFLECWLSEPEVSSLKPEPLPLEILYEDDHLLAVDKGDNLPVHPSSLFRGTTLANAVAWHLRQEGDNHRVHPVTRLDRNTAGITLFAKTAHAQHVLGKQAAQDLFHKEYLGVTVGTWGSDPAEDPGGSSPRGTLDMPIRRKPGSIIEREAHPTGDASVTHYEVLQVFTPTGTGSDPSGLMGSDPNGATLAAPAGAMGSDPIPTCSLVRFRLETGRTHQIRVHCAAKGHPLLGDTLYGGPAFAPLAGQALICDRLVFRHPAEGSMVEIRSRRNFPMFMLGFTPPF